MRHHHDDDDDARPDEAGTAARLRCCYDADAAMHVRLACLGGAGLSMEDALVYWQREFTKGMSGEEFVKRYAYNIRYNYGKEGKRSDFSPYSCVKIITASAPAGDEVHGEHQQPAPE